MYLAYLDDSDTKAKCHKWQVLCGVILKDTDFHIVEALMATIAEDLVPPEKLEEFTEFHAAELYGGYGVFAGIPQEKRFEAITELLALIMHGEVAIVYGAVDLQRLQEEVFASADPVDIAFRICAEGIDKFVDSERSHPDPDSDPSAVQVAMLIADDCDGKTKASMQKSFRNLRKPIRPPAYGGGKLHNVHDDMYFGDSKYSIGIQLADLSSYFIARHLEGDTTIDGFYGMIKDSIVYGRIAPEEENGK